MDEATNGQDAVLACRAGAYDAILMDVNMPVMDGFEATAEIRALEGDAMHTPILAMTASVDSISQAKAAGMDDSVRKPVDADELAAVLARWIVTS